MLAILFFSTAIQLPPPVTLQGRVVVRIVKPAVTSEETWERTAPERRRRISIVDPDGRRVAVFVIEYE